MCPTGLSHRGSPMTMAEAKKKYEDALQGMRAALDMFEAITPVEPPDERARAALEHHRALIADVRAELDRPVVPDEDAAGRLTKLAIRVQLIRQILREEMRRTKSTERTQRKDT